MLFTRVWLFIVGLLISGGALWLSYYAAFRYAWGESVFRFSLATIQWIRLSLIVGSVAMGGFIAFTFASSLSNQYGNFLLFMNAADFGIEDPQFHNDVGFYTFVLPVLHTIQGWLMGLALVTLVTTTGLYMLIFSARGINPAIGAGTRTQLALTGAWLMVTIAFAHFLDRYETLFSPAGAVTGTAYTDVNARLPALLVLTVIALLSAGIMLYAIRVANLRQSLRLIFAAFGLWLIAGIVAGIGWPMLTQRLAVAPSELQRERPYIERNIEWTRMGFDLGRVDTRLHDVDEATLAEGIARSPETIRNIRLWDPRPLEAVLNQLQHLRLYYSFLDVDVDRYVVDGEYRQVLLGARELFQRRLGRRRPELGEPRRYLHPRLRRGDEHSHDVQRVRPARLHRARRSPHRRVRDHAAARLLRRGVRYRRGRVHRPPEPRPGRGRRDPARHRHERRHRREHQRAAIRPSGDRREETGSPECT